MARDLGDGRDTHSSQGKETAVDGHGGHAEARFGRSSGTLAAPVASRQEVGGSGAVGEELERRSSPVEQLVKVCPKPDWGLLNSHRRPLAVLQGLAVEKEDIHNPLVVVGDESKGLGGKRQIPKSRL